MASWRNTLHYSLDGRTGAPAVEKPKTVLVIDDDLRALEKYASILETAGFRVIRGQFGAKPDTQKADCLALSDISAVMRYVLNREHHVDAVLTDLELYNEKTKHQYWFGEEIVKQLNSVFNGSIFVVSGGLTAEKKLQLIESGANGAFPKPLTEAGWGPITAEIHKVINAYRQTAGVA